MPRQKALGETISGLISVADFTAQNVPGKEQKMDRGGGRDHMQLFKRCKRLATLPFYNTLYQQLNLNNRSS